MKLTGKCKEAFEKWLTNLKFTNENYDNLDAYSDLKFSQYPTSMQFGVYVDFFDSMEIHIECGGIDFINLHYWFNIQERKTISGVTDIEYKSRGKARSKAIEKANKIYNEKN